MKDLKISSMLLFSQGSRHFAISLDRVEKTLAPISCIDVMNLPAIFEGFIQQGIQSIPCLSLEAFFIRAGIPGRWLPPSGGKAAIILKPENKKGALKLALMADHLETTLFQDEQKEARAVPKFGPEPCIESYLHYDGLSYGVLDILRLYEEVEYYCTHSITDKFENRQSYL